MAAPLLNARVPQSLIPSIYTRIAHVYDLWAILTESRARKACFNKAGVRDGEAVLEVAVGTGLLFREIVAANPNGLTEGIDLTESMLDRARRKVASMPGRHRLRVGDAHHLDFPDGGFDLLVNNYMFDLMPQEDFAPVLGEFRRVLKPGGRLVLVNMATADRWNLRLYETLYKFRPSLLGGCRGVSLASALQTAGFTGIVVEHVSQFGFPSEVVTAQVPAAGPSV